MNLGGIMTYLCWSPFLLPVTALVRDTWRWLQPDRAAPAPPVPPGRITSSDLQWLADHDLELAWTLPSATHDADWGDA